MNKLFSWDRSGKNARPARTAERAAEALREACAAAESGEIKAATKLFDESIGIYRSIGAKREEALAYHAMALAHTDDSAYATAFEAFTAALNLYRAQSLKRDLAACLRDSGLAEAEYSNSEEARYQLVQSLELYTELADDSGIASVNLAMGRAARHDDDLPAARDYISRSLEMYTKLGNADRCALCLVGLSSIALAESDFAAARSHFFTGIDVYCESVEVNSLTANLRLLADAAFPSESDVQISELLSAAATIYSTASSHGSRATALVESAFTDGSDTPHTDTEVNRRREASACLILAPVAYSQDRKTAALTLLESAISTAQDLDDSGLICYVLLQSGRIAFRNDDLSSAWTYYSKLVEVANSDDLATYRSAALYGVANTAIRSQDYEAAVQPCEECLELLKTAKDVVGTAHAMCLYGTLIHEQGDTETGINLLQESLAVCKRADDPAGAAAALAALGDAAMEYDPDYALLCCNECIQSDDADDFVAAGALQTSAELQLKLGELAVAYEQSARALALRATAHDRIGAAASLECCAHIAVEWGDIETAVVFLAKSQQITDDLTILLRPGAQRRYDGNVSALRQEMGDTDFENAWAEGSSLSLEDVAEEAALLLEGIEPDESGDEEFEEELEE